MRKIGHVEREIRVEDKRKMNKLAFNRGDNLRRHI